MRAELAVIGIIVSIIYLLLVSAMGLANLQSFEDLRPDEIADFLSGVLGPLALFWLILCYFQQGKELSNSVEALRLQAEELRNAVEQQKRLVSITGEQLKLDTDSRNEQVRSDFAKTLPFILLQSAGSRGVIDGQMHQFEVRNVGALATEVLVELAPDDEQIGIQQRKFVVSSGDRFEVEILALKPWNFEISRSFAVTAFNMRGHVRKQVFSFTRGKFLLISCDPEDR